VDGVLEMHYYIGDTVLESQTQLTDSELEALTADDWIEVDGSGATVGVSIEKDRSSGPNAQTTWKKYIYWRGKDSVGNKNYKSTKFSVTFDFRDSPYPEFELEDESSSNYSGPRSVYHDAFDYKPVDEWGQFGDILNVYDRKRGMEGYVTPVHNRADHVARLYTSYDYSVTRRFTLPPISSDLSNATLQYRHALVSDLETMGVDDGWIDVSDDITEFSVDHGDYIEITITCDSSETATVPRPDTIGPTFGSSPSRQLDPTSEELREKNLDIAPPLTYCTVYDEPVQGDPDPGWIWESYSGGGWWWKTTESHYGKYDIHPYYGVPRELNVLHLTEGHNMVTVESKIQWRLADFVYGATYYSSSFLETSFNLKFYWIMEYVNGDVRDLFDTSLVRWPTDVSGIIPTPAYTSMHDGMGHVAGWDIYPSSWWEYTSGSTDFTTLGMEFSNGSYSALLSGHTPVTDRSEVDSIVKYVSWFGGIPSYYGAARLVSTVKFLPVWDQNFSLQPWDARIYYGETTPPGVSWENRIKHKLFSGHLNFMVYNINPNKLLGSRYTVGRSAVPNLSSYFYDTEVGVYLWFMGNTTSNGYGDPDQRHMGLTLRAGRTETMNMPGISGIHGDIIEVLELCFVYGDNIIVLDDCFMHSFVYDDNGHPKYREKDYNFSLVMCATTDNELTFKMKVNRRITMGPPGSQENYNSPRMWDVRTHDYGRDPYWQTAIPPYDNRDMTDQEWADIVAQHPSFDTDYRFNVGWEDMDISAPPWTPNLTCAQGVGHGKPQEYEWKTIPNPFGDPSVIGDPHTWTHNGVGWHDGDLGLDLPAGANDPRGLTGSGSSTAHVPVVNGFNLWWGGLPHNNGGHTDDSIITTRKSRTIQCNESDIWLYAQWMPTIGSDIPAEVAPDESPAKKEFYDIPVFARWYDDGWLDNS